MVTRSKGQMGFHPGFRAQMSFASLKNDSATQESIINFLLSHLYLSNHVANIKQHRSARHLCREKLFEDKSQDKFNYVDSCRCAKGLCSLCKIARIARLARTCIEEVETK